MRAIITFHSIDESNSVLSFPPQSFEDFLANLAVPVYDLGTLLSSGAQYGIALTFDDGIASVFSQALPIIKDYGIKAHLFLTTGAVGGDNRWPGQPPRAPCFRMLTWEEIEACYAAGIYIESHTVNHPDLRKLDNKAVEEECQQADEIIEARLGRRPNYFAYPYGYINERIRNFARRRYKASVTTELRAIRDQEDLAALPRLDSYYLKSPWMYRRLCAPATRAYLGLRNASRSLRGIQ
ncbi:MAG: polysaccharide deacetylase family protein [Gammaproteobacteria bacterium]|nr:polysaccharide deacetylase family protein [Gammaproteobacteria bacterium]